MLREAHGNAGDLSSVLFGNRNHNIIMTIRIIIIIRHGNMCVHVCNDAA